MRKRCPYCRQWFYGDANEYHECDEHPDPERDMVKRPVAYKPTIVPREYNTEAYIRQRWQEFDMR